MKTHPQGAKSFIAKAHASTATSISPKKVMRQCHENRKGYVLHTGGQRNLFTFHVLPVKESGVKLYDGKSIFFQPLMTTFHDTLEVLQDSNSMSVFAFLISVTLTIPS
eukprot:scaffold173701_cov23-Cyclotella_meneghiniana.AAC.2